MNIQNPFEEIADRLTRIENCLLTLKDSSQPKANPSDPNRLLTISQAGELLNLAVPTIYGLCHRSMIPVCKRGKRLYFSEQELLNWIKAGRRLTVDEIKEVASESLHSNKKEGGKQ